VIVIPLIILLEHSVHLTTAMVVVGTRKKMEVRICVTIGTTVFEM